MPRIVRFHQTGGAEVLQIEELPLAEPGQGEVRLKVEAIGLNRAEVAFREGRYLEAPSLPSGLGYEAAGVVDALGAGVTGIKVGERVSTVPAFSMREYSTYGEIAIVPAHAVASYPGWMSPIEGASIWMQYVTAYGPLVEYSNIQPGTGVLITAASSSVGLAAIQIARAAGAIVVATTRTSAKKQVLLDSGASAVIATEEEDIVSRIREITADRGVAIVFDSVAGPMLETLAQVAATGASIFEYGALSLEPTPFPLVAALQKGLTVRGYTLFEITTDPEKLERAKHYIYEGLESRRLRPAIDRVFALEDIVEAHRYMESNQQLGKIVVTV